MKYACSILFLSSSLAFGLLIPTSASAEVNAGINAFRNLNEPAAGHCNLPPAEKFDAQKQKCFADRLSESLKRNKGQESGGACMMGVRTAIEMTSGRSQIPWCNKASDAGNCLKALGMGVAYSVDDKGPGDKEPPRPDLVRNGKDWTAEWRDKKYAKVNFKTPDGAPKSAAL